MDILKAIGGVFVKIWRWIKNTAWVQPLLIVGAIFGVIFSIPAISNGIQEMINASYSADTFYHSFQLSMEGGADSAADKLFYNYLKYEDGDITSLPENEQKYFIMFTKTGDSGSSDLKAGFEVLRDNWGTTFVAQPGEHFKLYTIFTDEETSQTKKHESAFSQFISRHYSFFEEASQRGIKTNYYINGKVSKDDLNNLAVPDPDQFKTPTLMLIDWTKVVTPDNEGITQVFFNIDGDDGWQKAPRLSDCWNNKGDFGPQDK